MTQSQKTILVVAMFLGAFFGLMPGVTQTILLLPLVPVIICAGIYALVGMIALLCWMMLTVELWLPIVAGVGILIAAFVG